MRKPQRGVALAVALMLLVIITLIGLAGVRMSGLELRMSGNDQLRVDSFEIAQSLIDASIVSFANTPVMATGQLICAAASTSWGCNTATIVLPANLGSTYTPADPSVNVFVQRVPPAVGGPPPGSGYSTDKFASANMQVTAVYNQTAGNRGQATISEGVAIVFPSSNEIYFSQ